MRETFLRAVPEALRARVGAWGVDRDPNDEVGVIWERIARGTLIGAGFGRVVKLDCMVHLIALSGGSRVLR